MFFGCSCPAYASHLPLLIEYFFRRNPSPDPVTLPTVARSPWVIRARFLNFMINVSYTQRASNLKSGREMTTASTAFWYSWTKHDGIPPDISVEETNNTIYKCILKKKYQTRYAVTGWRGWVRFPWRYIIRRWPKGWIFHFSVMPQRRNHVYVVKILNVFRGKRPSHYVPVNHFVTTSWGLLTLNTST